MRLIDADKLKQSVTNEMLKAELNSPVYLALECVIADIEKQPIAYNVEKVVGQLKDHTIEFEIFGQCSDYVESSHATEIIKAGGVHE